MRLWEAFQNRSPLKPGQRRERTRELSIEFGSRDKVRGLQNEIAALRDIRKRLERELRAAKMRVDLLEEELRLRKAIGRS